MVRRGLRDGEEEVARYVEARVRDLRLLPNRCESVWVMEWV